MDAAYSLDIDLFRIMDCKATVTTLMTDSYNTVQLSEPVD